MSINIYTYIVAVMNKYIVAVMNICIYTLVMNYCYYYYYYCLYIYVFNTAYINIYIYKQCIVM